MNISYILILLNIRNKSNIKEILNCFNIFVCKIMDFFFCFYGLWLEKIIIEFYKFNFKFM